MFARSIHSSRILVMRLILVSFLLFPWPVLADEGVALPLSKIVLYSSGVGYFQHDGSLNNRAQLDLRFNVSQINDMLKSLVVQDFGGGKVSTITYGSHDPVTKTLGNFGVNLNGNPTLGQILTQVRGESVEVAAPNPIAGTLLGVEKKAESVGEGSQRRVIEQEYITLLTEDGLRSLSLANVQRIKLTNPALNAELHQALAALAANHDAQKKTVSITFDGTGNRRARVAYLTETPVWKTSYRLVLDEDKSPYLQGWAIVENQTPQDWRNVTLSLVSGRPISFTMDLYQPLYNPRPVVQPELYANLRPQTYGDAMDELKAAASPSPARSDMKKERLLGKLAQGFACILHLVRRHRGAGLGHRRKPRRHEGLRHHAQPPARLLHPLRRHRLCRRSVAGRGRPARRHQVEEPDDRREGQGRRDPGRVSRPVQIQPDGQARARLQRPGADAGAVGRPRGHQQLVGFQ
ncbi:MAG TPA: hypothetical protein VLL94_05925, partial [Nitrospiraceae bacterium]|nr:hypothetical protein [Nitrospiraceae bacterium]